MWFGSGFRNRRGGRKLYAAFGEDGAERGNERGGVKSARGLGEEFRALAEEEIAEAEVRSVAQPGDGGADPLLGFAWDPVLVAIAVEDRGDDAARYPGSPTDSIAVYS